MILNRQDAKNAKFLLIAARGATKLVAPVRQHEGSLNLRENPASPLAPWRLNS
jgi:hypothetical protein